MTTIRIRGVYGLNDHAFWAINDGIYDMLADGTITASYGPIADDGGQVRMAGNASWLTLASAGTAYSVGSGSLAAITWIVDGLGNLIPIADVAFLNQYFLFLPVSGHGFYYSEPGDPTIGDVLNFIPAEANANIFERMVVHEQRIWLFGDQCCQVFVDQSASDPDNPFGPDFSGVIQFGSAAPSSVTIFDNSIGWIGRTTSGQGIAYRNNGYLPQRVSTFAVEAQWSKYSQLDDAWGYTVTWRGHTVWRIWFPSADETWQYDASVPREVAWTKVLYFNSTSGEYEADRGICATLLGGKVLVGDRENGLIYEMDPDYYFDDDERIRWLRRAPIISQENKLISFPWFELDAQAGVGDGSNLDPDAGVVTPEADPQVLMRYSNDWGNTWSDGLLRSMGKQGEYSKRMIWGPNGMGRQRVFELSGSAAVPLVINNVYLRDPIGGAT